MEENCIFCKIISGKVAAQIVYEDENMIIMKDIEPKAKIHLLAIPKRHFALLTEMTQEDAATLGKIFMTIAEKSQSLGLADGYRLIINQGENAGQTVHHLHVHIIGGQVLNFPRA